MELSTDRIIRKVVAVSRSMLREGSRHLDVGAGTGALIRALRAEYHGVRTHACDDTDALMHAEDQRVDIADFNRDALPYDSASFDLVACTEVIEHLENCRGVNREIFRVTRPGGGAVCTTPNVLNLQSRHCDFQLGFWNLFGPLPVGRSEGFSTIAHITPVTHFYLAHALTETEFTVRGVEGGELQRSAMVKLWLYWPFIAFLGLVARRRE